MKEDDSGWSLDDSIMEGWQCTMWNGIYVMYFVLGTIFGFWIPRKEEGRRVGLCSVGGTAQKKFNS
jgi:hypothetical protein